MTVPLECWSGELHIAKTIGFHELAERVFESGNGDEVALLVNHLN